MPINLSRTRLGNWNVVWDSYDFGAVDKVTPKIAYVTKSIAVGSMGDVPLGKRFIRPELKITIEAREIDLALLKKLMPWWTSGSIPLTPQTLHQDLYAYAKLLTLHPSDLAADNHEEDLNIVKAVPDFSPMERDGVADDKIIVEFEAFPDRAHFPDTVYGYVGPVP
jgi:hypothetical protein